MDINWPSGVITVYKTDSFMTWTSGVIYNLDTDLFRRALKDKEDDAVGMCFSDTHRHNTTVLLGGIEYARIIEILPPYTITFDDTGGAWVCNLIGSNNNILDRTNLTTVQVRANNSAGLVQMSEIQHGIFNDRVTIDTIRGVAGTTYPIGTPIQPVNNLADAKTIANYRGFSVFHVIGSLTVADIDISGFTLQGTNAANSSVVLDTTAVLTNCEIREVQVSGYLDSECLLRECYVDGLAHFNGIFHQCAFTEAPVILSGTFPAIFLDCYSASITDELSIIDCANGSTPLILRGWKGCFKVINRNLDGVYSCLNFSGYCKLDSSITAGGWDISGVGDLDNQATGTAVVDKSKLVHGDEISSSVWSYTRP